MIDWLHDCYFAGVAGDAPAFERWPTQESYHLHEYILSLWGMPLGEMWNLERLAAKCRELGRWTFFLTSAPANVPGMLHPIISSHLSLLRYLYCYYYSWIFWNEHFTDMFCSVNTAGVSCHANATAIF